MRVSVVIMKMLMLVTMMRRKIDMPTFNIVFVMEIDR